MTVSIVKSENITDIAASPRVALRSNVFNSKHVIDTIALATTSIDEVGDIILFGPVPTNAVIHKIEVVADDLDSHGTPTLAYDVGLYYTGIGVKQKLTFKTLGVVVDADCFASAITTGQSAVKAWTEITYEAGVNDQNDVQKEAWDMGGLSADPGGYFAVGLTITTEAATAAAGDYSIRISYSLPNS